MYSYYVCTNFSGPLQKLKGGPEYDVQTNGLKVDLVDLVAMYNHAGTYSIKGWAHSTIDTVSMCSTLYGTVPMH